MYNKKKLILVTGGAGFIGSHLCRRLVQENYHVISLDNYFTGSRDNHVEGVDYREGHTKNVSSLVPESDIDIVYHLGEYARVEQSLLEPDLVRDLNVIGTEGVLNFWKRHRCKLIYAGSSTKFGDSGTARHTTPYASTKATNTERVKEIGDVEGLPYAITYFYNVYGPGERSGIYGTLIEAFKQMYLSGAPLTVTSPGTQKRNFTHVEDIVDALILVGENGHGDEYGLGHEKSFTILEVAHLFGGEIVMLPERAGNRMASVLDATKISALGWRPKHTLEGYIREFLTTHRRGIEREKRVLVFSTTFHPTTGPAENTLIELMRKMPDVQFDIVTTKFSLDARKTIPPTPNAHIHRVGFGYSTDKYLLPCIGFWKGRVLYHKHRYLFAWSIMASYAALAGVLLKRTTKMPLLITLADQDFTNASAFTRLLLRIILSDADQVYGASISQEKHAAHLASVRFLRRSIGEGDAFANQLRYAYAEILLNQKHTEMKLRHQMTT